MRGQPFVFSDYSGGVDRESAPYAIDATRARDLLNVSTSPVGSVRKRNGFETLTSFAKAVTSLGTYERGGTKYLLAIGDDGSATDIHSITPAGTATSRKGSATITSGRRWEFVQAPVSGGQGSSFMLNGSDTPLQWTGSGNVASWTASSGTLPNGKFIIYHDNRVIVAGVETDYTTRSTLYASGLADPRVWASPSAVTTLLDPDDGQEITGLGTVGPYVIVFKPRKSFIVTDSTTLGYRNLSDTRGCVSHRSIVPTDEGTFFLTSERTICVTDGTSIHHISEPVDSLLRDLPTANITHAAAVFRNERYYLSLSTGGVENDTILEYDTRNQSWWIHRIYLSALDTTAINDWAILDPQGAATLYGASASITAPAIFTAFKPNLYTDASGQAYPSYWITGWNTFQAPHIRKVISQVRADAKGQYVFYTAKSFSAAYDLESTLTWEASAGEEVTHFGVEYDYGGTGIYGDGTSIYENRYYTPGVARAWSFKFENNEASEWELYSHTIGIETRTD